MSTEFGKRLKIARKHAKLSQIQLSKAIGISQSSVAHLETVGQGSSHVHQIALTCGVSTQWLSTGEGTMLSELSQAILAYSPYVRDAIHTAQEPQADYNVTPSQPRGKVPLISWVQAGDFCDAVDPHPTGNGDEWLDCPMRHSKNTYALLVRGSSMHNPTGDRSFAEGDIIFIDPDRQPQHRSLVICRLDGSNEATFKRLLLEGDAKMLEALNPSWPDRIVKVEGNATICGVVIGKVESYI